MRPVLAPRAAAAVAVLVVAVAEGRVVVVAAQVVVVVARVALVVVVVAVLAAAVVARVAVFAVARAAIEGGKAAVAARAVDGAREPESFSAFSFRDELSEVSCSAEVEQDWESITVGYLLPVY